MTDTDNDHCNSYPQRSAPVVAKGASCQLDIPSLKNDKRKKPAVSTGQSGGIRPIVVAHARRTSLKTAMGGGHRRTKQPIASYGNGARLVRTPVVNVNASDRRENQASASGSVDSKGLRKPIVTTGHGIRRRQGVTSGVVPKRRRPKVVTGQGIRAVTRPAASIDAGIRHEKTPSVCTGAGVRAIKRRAVPAPMTVRKKPLVESGTGVRCQK